MLRVSWKYPFLFIMVVLLQIFIFNNIQVSGYINPQIYVFFILILPLNIKGWQLLLIAFFTGLIIDAFCDSLAIHALSSLFMAFFRPTALRVFGGSFDPEDDASPSFYNLGMLSLMFYAFSLIFIHHTTLFMLELFRFNELADLFNRSLISSILSTVFVMIAFAFVSRMGNQKTY